MPADRGTQVNIIQQSWNGDDLVSGRVDAMSAYAKVEPYQLLAKGVVHPTPRSADFGVDFYGDILLTTEAQLARRPVARWRVNKAGDVVWVNTRVPLVRTLDDTPADVIAVMQDITGRRAIKAQLRHSERQREADRQKAPRHVERLNAALEARVRQRTAELEKVNLELGVFSYSDSHDLRAPPTAIEGFANQLGRTEADRLGDKSKKIPAADSRSGQRHGSADRRLARAGQGVRHPVGAQRARPVGHGTTGHSRKPETQSPAPGAHRRRTGFVSVQGDRVLLTTDVQNLLGNAWKFTAKSDAAAISLSSHVSANGERGYGVKDNSAGFDMVTASKLFGTFERLHASTQYPATGIGLSIVKRVIERQGGRIWAETRVPESATFYFTLGPAAIARKAIDQPLSAAVFNPYEHH